MKCLRFLPLFAVAVLFAAATLAHAQTDVAASYYGTFSGTTEGNGTVQSPSNQSGYMLEMRHISNPLVGYELNYSFNRANQGYNFTSVKAAAHEVGADWFVSWPILNFKPFLLAGGGLLFLSPDSGQPGTRSNTKPVFVYGGGLDWTVIPHFGLRFQYRGNVYHAPDLLKAVSNTHTAFNTAEPMIGAYFRF